MNRSMLALLIPLMACRNVPSFAEDAGENLADAALQSDAFSAQGTIVIQPADVLLTVVSGTPVPTTSFTATLGAMDVTPWVTWSFGRPEIGDVISGSTFTPTGKVGGSAKLTARVDQASGSTSVSVHVEKTILGGVGPSQKATLDAPSGGPDPSATVVYPYDRTVFPIGVLAPQLQWNGAQPTDVYKLELEEKYFDYVEYIPIAPANHTIDEADWQSITLSGSGPTTDPLKVSLTRLSGNGNGNGNKAYAPMTSTWHIAQGRLRGAIYYWELPDQCGTTNGRVLRIKPDAKSPEVFAQQGTACYGCHTVSRDGTTMMGAFDMQQSAFALQTLDLKKTPAVLGKIQQGAMLGGTFSAFNGKGDKLLVSNNDPIGLYAELSSLSIINANNGSVVTPNAMPAGCGEPAWSPDGKHIAGVCNLTGNNWTFDSPTGALTIADVAADGATVSNPKSLVPQGSPGRPAYPSFSPDSQWIAFGRPTVGARSIGAGDLWLTDLGGQNLKHLVTASSDDKSFNPVFAPLRAGGYSWIVFMSRRDYGNQIVSADRQQLWIAAIDDPPTAADPSHPPFYVRGQEPCAKSENAYYALEPCKKNGEGCTSGIDCCGGICLKGVCGMPNGCSSLGNACTADTDCCDPSARCIDMFCQVPPPK